MPAQLTSYRLEVRQTEPIWPWCTLITGLLLGCFEPVKNVESVSNMSCQCFMVNCPTANLHKHSSDELWRSEIQEACKIGLHLLHCCGADVVGPQC